MKASQGAKKELEENTPSSSKTKAAGITQCSVLDLVDIEEGVSVGDMNEEHNLGEKK